VGRKRDCNRRIGWSAVGINYGDGEKKKTRQKLSEEQAEESQYGCRISLEPTRAAGEAALYGLTIHLRKNGGATDQTPNG